jgi:quercetin dioxygenase-like cupin family protein
MPERPEVTDLTGLAAGWTAQADDLRASVVTLLADQSLAGHVNWETDVVLIGVEGGGSVVLDGQAQDLAPLSLVMVPRGVRRELRAGPDEPFRVLVVHRRTAVSGSWRWRPARRRPWEDDPWDEEPDR